MKTDLISEEVAVKSGGANYMRGAEAVGGKLHLTNQRLVFESHALNIQTGVTIVPLSEIADIVPCWTKFLGLIPLVPNSLAVTTADGAEHRFVLYGRGKWKRAIESQQS